MNLTLPLDKLEAEARAITGPESRLHELRTRRLEGGYVAEGVYRLDLVMDLAGGGQQEVSFVQKYAPPCELIVLRALNSETPHPCIPRLVESGVFEGRSWFIYPYYPGEVLSWDDAIPADVLRMLALVHSRFERRQDECLDVPRVDRLFFLKTFQAGLNALASQRELYREEHRLLSQICADERVYAALESLPLTLTHGDVHPGNLVQTGQGGVVLIDWGNARMAPAALDLANMLDYGSPEWNMYLAAREEAADSRQTELGYRWAELMVNTQYLPFAVEHLSPEDARKMVEKSAVAQARIAELIC